MMAHTIDEPIIEGFICPHCMSSFRTAEVLQIHFTKKHNAKTAISRTSDNARSSLSAIVPVLDAYSFAFYDRNLGTQPLGCVRSLTADLKRWRASRIARDASRINTLLLRLDKLICLPPAKLSGRREAEKTIVNWIDAKVDLCPSCGQRFGLGVQEAYPESSFQSDSLLDASPSNSFARNLSIAHLSKRTLALLDYNPVFRRRHHCRLCGFVLCADCSYFLDRPSAVRLMKAVDRFNLDHRTESTAGGRRSTDSPTLTDQPIVFTRDLGSSMMPFELDREPSVASHWRICKVCKAVLEKKSESLRERYHVSPVVQLHLELKNLMNKVNESLPGYTTIANSLHSGEQRYDLEMAKTMRHELLESLLQIDASRKRIEQLESSTKSQERPNLALLRLLRALGTMARQFLQHNLPPLRILPTLQQYDSLTAQRQDELAARWEQEERALSELEKCLSQPTKSTARHNMVSTPNDLPRRLEQHVTVEDLSKLAARIDDASRRLMCAKRSGSHHEVLACTAELDRLENAFQSCSQRLQSRHT